MCDNISNTFDPFLALSLPIPKNKFTRLTITYFPHQISEDNPTKSIKVNVGATDSVEDVKAKIQEIVKTENPILLYTLRRKNLIGERVDNDVRAMKLEDEKLTAYEYLPIEPEEKKKTSCVEVTFAKETNSMFGSSSTEDVCAPKIFLHNVGRTCTDLKYEIFKYLFPLIKLPEQYQEGFEKAENKENFMKKIYDAFYHKSDFGKNKVFTVQFEKEKSNYYSQRKFIEFEDSEETFGEFIENLKSNDEVSLRVNFPRATKVNLDCLEARRDSSASYGDSAAISIDDCLDRFSAEELLTDDNKYYCSKCKEHQDTYKKMDLYKLPKIL